MSNDAPEGPGAGGPERGARRSPRLGDSGAPIGSTLSIVLALVAVVAGFLILRAISDDDGDTTTTPVASSPVDSAGGATTTTVAGGDNPGTVGETTTTLAMSKTGATVIVANANSTGGSAGRMTRALENAGYTVIDPVDAVAPDNQLKRSKVYFATRDAAARAVANAIARDLGGVRVVALPAEPPVEGGDVGKARVLVMLGDDAADKTLEELAPDDATGSTNPDVAGATTTDPGD